MLTRALWLQSYAVIRGMEPRYLSRRNAVYSRLRDYAYQDDVTVNRALDRLEEQQSDLIDHVDALNRRLFCMVNGHPHLLPGKLNRSVIRIVDPDALISMHKDLNPLGDDDFQWCAIPEFSDAEEKNLTNLATYETHFHLGGALPPLCFWLALMGGDVVFGRFSDSITKTLDRKLKQKWQEAIDGAARLRLQIAGHLAHYYWRYRKVDIFPHVPLKHWIDCGAVPEEGLADPPVFPIKFASKLKNQPIRDLTFEILKHLMPGRNHNQGRGFLDPLQPFPQEDSFSQHFALGERKLLYYLRQFLDTNPSSDGERRFQRSMAIAAECYVVGRFSFHRLAVHDEGSQGLFRFVQSFAQRGGFLMSGRSFRQRRARNRMRRYTRKLERDRMLTTLETHLGARYRRNREAHRQEIRVSLGVGSMAVLELRAWAEGALRFAEKNDSPCLTMPNTLTIHAHKGGSREMARGRALGMARRLSHILEERPGLRTLITGFDCAGRERENPPRVFCPAYQHLKARMAQFRSNRWEPDLNLGFTFHVGEDYDDLLNALRHLDETVRLLLPSRAGGRLGHALALGDSPIEFYRRRAPSREVELGAHLLDLVWAWGKLQEGGRLQDFLDLEQTIGKTINLAGSRESSNAGLLSWVYGMMFQKPAIARSELLRELKVGSGPRQYISVQGNAQWLEMVSACQKLIQKELVEKPITVESNPTSNLVIGYYRNYGDLPYRDLVDAGFPLSLNTDDPGMFMTTLPGEFAAIYRSFLSKGMTHREIRSWLEDRAADARNSLFGGIDLPVFQGDASLPRDLLLDRLFKRGPWTARDAAEFKCSTSG